MIGGPGSDSLRERCIYDSFTTSAVVLAILLLVIVALLVLLVLSCCMLTRKMRDERKLKSYQ